MVVLCAVCLFRIASIDVIMLAFAFKFPGLHKIPSGMRSVVKALLHIVVMMMVPV